jgi:hypothetical protein
MVRPALVRNMRRWEMSSHRKREVEWFKGCETTVQIIVVGLGNFIGQFIDTPLPPRKPSGPIKLTVPPTDLFVLHGRLGKGVPSATESQFRVERPWYRHADGGDLAPLMVSVVHKRIRKERGHARRLQKLAKPNQHEAQALRIIARYGRMRVTMINGRAHFTAGPVEITNQVARNLIRQGRVSPTSPIGIGFYEFSVTGGRQDKGLA